MGEVARRRIYRASTFLAFAATATLLAACATDTKQVASHHSKEYFSEKEYGVKASPRVSYKQSRLPRGGGREQVGDPYQVKGKWYYPKDYKHYSAVGAASWYGDAFHGRLTANGEIYDQTNLTAAHPTLPLPCYARVTNLLNGSSVIVRVNDRGPYAPGRIIDLSKRAAQLLDYSRTGVAEVKVDYIGKAPLEGNDEPFLLASYRPGDGERSPLPGRDTAPGVMVAMNGPTPTGSHVAAPFPRQLRNAAATPPAGIFAAIPQARPNQAVAALDQVTARSSSPAPILVADVRDAGDPVLPTIGPIVPERPEFGASETIASEALPTLGYADMRIERASKAFDLIVKPSHGMTPSAIVASWRREQSGGKSSGDTASYIAVGSFADAAEAEMHRRDLSRFGRATISVSRRDGGTYYSVDLHPDGRSSLDTMLRQAWADGARDAMTVRE
jgi:rare lipoprotein A